MSRRTTAIAAALSVLALGSPLNVARANPPFVEYFNQGVERMNSGNYQGAIADYTKAIEIDPQYANAYVNRGIDRKIINDLKGACLDWRKAAGLGKENAAEWVKKQCQASTSAQQMEWEKMLVGESAEDDQAAAEGYSLRGEGVPDGVPFSIEGKPAPDDFVDAQCINEDDVREPCKLKVDRINKAIGIWTPPGRVSSRLSIFKGSCLDAGCVLQNPDYGYPEEYRGTTKVVSWSGEHGGLLLRQDHGYEFEVVPLTPFSF